MDSTDVVNPKWTTESIPLSSTRNDSINDSEDSFAKVFLSSLQDRYWHGNVPLGDAKIAEADNQNYYNFFKTQHSKMTTQNYIIALSTATPNRY